MASPRAPSAAWCPVSRLISPPSLAAHDIGLRDLLDSFYLTGEKAPEVLLFAVSIALPQDMTTELSPAVAEAVPEVAELVRAELN